MEKKPTHLACSVRDYATELGKQDASWLRIGAAWAARTHERCGFKG
jgi:hypothetical protein